MAGRDENLLESYPVSSGAITISIARNGASHNQNVAQLANNFGALGNPEHTDAKREQWQPFPQRIAQWLDEMTHHTLSFHPDANAGQSVSGADRETARGSSGETTTMVGVIANGDELMLRAGELLTRGRDASTTANKGDRCSGGRV